MNAGTVIESCSHIRLSTKYVFTHRWIKRILSSPSAVSTFVAFSSASVALRSDAISVNEAQLSMMATDLSLIGLTESPDSDGRAIAALALPSLISSVERRERRIN